MGADGKLPRDLGKALDSVDGDERKAIWDRWELQQWVEATRSRGLAFFALDPDVQRRLIEAIDDRRVVAN
ncbi:MAG TPA: hypothetical protein VFB22_13165 [Candidatus Baltobacteraceae bacterium]|nr:hypothetical protein [Candidatus Baltobacteraceae bacterium]